jgi:hypothetical protein
MKFFKTSGMFFAFEGTDTSDRIKAVIRSVKNQPDATVDEITEEEYETCLRQAGVSHPFRKAA